MAKYRTAAFIASSIAAVGILTSGTASATPVKSINALCHTQPTIVAEPGIATFGTEGTDYILGTPGDDEIYGGGGDDVICGEGGNDYVTGDDGRDEIHGGDGDDRIWLVDRTDDWTDCGGGYDSVTRDYEPLDRVVASCEDIVGG
nr:Alkaline phosphatase [Kibdelosporangium sp. MJ126-NF4]CTQ90694.1 Alkaline phosphatase (EC 3.1.3.1) [Kibdelosporangium sp. MJ126-NF4]